ncbi:sn-glycerol-3-phosphate ABC transporter ATP-binding protein UgpC [Agrobacterium cavarae]|uniref:Sn-glycerol-3-phosphate ABC transporter ATP-binding protein UgpC n=1 Tax=Agrobacterium cavarae TaxID=2528239 RepID=A0ABY1Y532_9HYPH|nr:sn-glycerol-3-phosphate ABC transporter ATP-binding protein UgpC [Agrobacterium cavarae]TBN10763.1 sn-glycerol-3-phosphate ABC transporter ATP-binding protein UgpC [Agrobacterium cavarae]
MTLQIELSGIQKHYGAYHALRGIDIAIPKGQFVALVGPSGCGKSSLLRTLAGLETISSGTIRIEGEDITRQPPRMRDIAMVFQSYALYPHMTVEKNLTYSLRLKGVSKAEARRKAEEIAQITGLTTLLARYPRELSGGQRQRVAMGRAIIRNPKAFLFDEPLSNLDAALRVHMRAEIRKLHNSLGATSVYVTHDQIEAMTMADHVVVMRAGVIEQQGAPLELYDRPVNRFVAGFIGSPAMNFVAAIAAEDGRTLVLNFGGKSEPQTIMSPVAFTPGARVTVGIRPEHITLAPPGSSTITLPVGIVETTGSATSVTTATQPEMTVALQGRSNVKAGDSVGFNIDPASLHLFDHETEQRL